MAAVVRIKGVELELGGRSYVIPPIPLGALSQLAPRIAQFTGNGFDADQVNTAIDCVFAALRRNYPDMTREMVGEILDMGNMGQAFEAVMGVSGLAAKAGGAPGEAVPAA